VNESTEGLSRSLEDYLEAIYNLIRARKNARVKDIAEAMNVKMPSVTGAIRSLVSKGLADHKPYDHVELTETGLTHAREIARKHEAVKRFLVDSLGLEESQAEEEACVIEHAIRPETLDRLLAFVEGERHVGGHNCCRFGGPPGQGRGQGRRLSELEPGAKGRIVRVRGRGLLRKRLMDMGLVSGTELEVVRAAPLGDPMEIRIRGYLLSLRRSEAEHIEVDEG